MVILKINFKGGTSKRYTFREEGDPKLSALDMLEGIEDGDHRKLDHREPVRDEPKEHRRGTLVDMKQIRSMEILEE